MTIETKNAIIKSTMLGIEDHGIMTCFLYLDYGDSAQGFGGHTLTYHAYGMKYFRAILETVGVMEWEALPGRIIRVRSEHSKVHAIGHVVKNVWFSPEDDLAKEAA